MPHLDRRQRIVLVIAMAMLFGAVAFVWLMGDLERASPATSGSVRAPSISVQPSPTAVPTVSDLPRGTVVANGRRIPVELALDEASQERGLSYRDSLPTDAGMLFVFDAAQKQMFWMNEMRFPLDMVFINGTKVVSVAADVPAQAGELPAFVSSVYDADKVLEINAGKAKEWGIGKGTEIAVERGL